MEKRKFDLHIFSFRLSYVVIYSLDFIQLFWLALGFFTGRKFPAFSPVLLDHP